MFCVIGVVIFQSRWENSARSWSAVAERSGDTAFTRTKRVTKMKTLHPPESGVSPVSRQPSHSKTLGVAGKRSGNPASLGRAKNFPLAGFCRCAGADFLETVNLPFRSELLSVDRAAADDWI